MNAINNAADRNYKNVLLGMVLSAVILVSMGLGAYASVWLVEPVQQQSGTGYGTHDTQTQTAAPKEIGTVRSGTGYLEKTDQHEQRAKDAREEERREEEVHAQITSVWWGRIAVAIAGLGLFITAGGTALLLKQIILSRETMGDTRKALKLAEQANLLAAKNAYAERRPWLVARSISLDAKQQGIANLWSVSLDIENHGKTAVVGANVHMKPFPVGANEMRTFLHDGQLGSTWLQVPILVPGETRTAETLLCFDLDEIVPSGNGTFWLAVVILYRSADGQDHKFSQSWLVGSRMEDGNMRPFNSDNFRSGQYVFLAATPTLTYHID